MGEIEKPELAERSEVMGDVARPSSAQPTFADAVDLDRVSTWLRLGTNGDQLPAAPASGDLLTRGVTVAICTYQRAVSLVRLLDSLVTQVPVPARVIIVDASPNGETERALRTYDRFGVADGDLLYFRVMGQLRGLTRQRNFALRWVTTDLVAFFDDDIVLRPGCCFELERQHRELGDEVVGVGALIENQIQPPWLGWRVRKWLRIVSHLRPGTFSRSGIPIPWHFVSAAEDGLLEGDWLPGGATMWRTAPAREVGFNERFEGYGNGEDLDFSFRIRPKGRLAVAGRARVLHLHDEGGRPDAYEMGYESVRNWHDIHRRCLPNRTWADVAYFLYAFWLDALIQFVAVLKGENLQGRWRFLLGRVRFLVDLCLGKSGERSRVAAKRP